jgi:hypothetical protein
MAATIINATTTGIVTTAGDEGKINLRIAGTDALEISNQSSLILNAVFLENDNAFSGEYSISSGKNAMTAGPVTLSEGSIVTVPNGSTWTVV